MTPREQATFAAGIGAGRQMALTAAAALQGLAEGLRTLMHPVEEPQS